MTSTRSRRNSTTMAIAAALAGMALPAALFVGGGIANAKSAMLMTFSQISATTTEVHIANETSTEMLTGCVYSQRPLTGQPSAPYHSQTFDMDPHQEIDLQTASDTFGLFEVSVACAGNNLGQPPAVDTLNHEFAIPYGPPPTTTCSPDGQVCSVHES